MEIMADRQEASRFAAELLAEAIRARLASAPRAALAVSGGSTPRACLEMLGAAELPWDRVDVTLTDERRVPVDDPASNEGMLRRTLLQGPAASARFVSVEPAALEALADPFAAVLVGMGDDGHFASIFPDAANLDQALDPDGSAICLPVTTAASPHPRCTLTLARLLASDLILLLAFGTDKRRILDAPGDLPVAALLRQRRTPVRVLWAS